MTYPTRNRAQQVADTLNLRRGFAPARVCFDGAWHVRCSWLPLTTEA